MNSDQKNMFDEMSPQQLAEMAHEKLVEKCLGLQRSYVSLLNLVGTYKRQLDAVRDHTLRSSQIAELSRKVNVADLEIITDVAIRDMRRFFEAEFGALYLFDSETRFLTLYKSYPDSPEHPSLHLDNDSDTAMVHFLRHHREPLIINSIEEYEEAAGEEFRSTLLDEYLSAGGLLCPLVIGMSQEESLVIGALVLGRKADGFSRLDTELASMMADILSAAMNTSRLLKQMSVLAETDGLTGVYNHRHFQQELDKATAFYRRYGHPLSLAMIDIDKFKAFNDRHGHQVGDYVLQQVARAIRATVRDQIDVVARYGGEEFTVIMPNTDLEGAIIVGERMREAVEALKIQIGGRDLTISISIGVAEQHQDVDKGDLIERADSAMYLAKKRGRNRLAVDGQ